MKINDSFSSWSEILFGVPQGSILGSVLFNILICDVFYFMINFEIANYVENSTPFSPKLDGSPAGNYKFKVSNSITRTRSEIDKYTQESSSVV